MTKAFVISVIRREDYDAFRRDAGLRLSDTYDEWAKLQTRSAKPGGSATPSLRPWSITTSSFGTVRRKGESPIRKSC